MTWIKVDKPADNPEVARALARAMNEYPAEYQPARRGELRLPMAVARDSIVQSHSLIPGALEHFFAGFGALLDPQLPLTRRQHEMIATTVSALNECFF